MSKLLLLICVGGLPCALCAQSNQTSWANLSVLRAGGEDSSHRCELEEAFRNVVSVSEAAISYEQIAGEQTIQKPDVRSVKRMRTKRRLLNTVLLGGVGAGVGAGIGAATYHDNPCPPTAFVCLNGIGGRGLPTALGAAIGLVGAQSSEICCPTTK